MRVLLCFSYPNLGTSSTFKYFTHGVDQVVLAEYYFNIFERIVVASHGHKVKIQSRHVLFWEVTLG